MPLGMEVGDFVFDVDPAIPKKGTPTPPMMPLGTEVNLGSCDVVLDGVAGPLKRGTAPSFRFMSVVAKRLDG